MHVFKPIFLIYINFLECFQNIESHQLKSWGQHFEEFEISSDKPSCNPSSDMHTNYGRKKGFDLQSYGRHVLW